MSVVLWTWIALSVAAGSSTRAGEEKSPAEAKISDFQWLSGYWISDERGGFADECWLPPEGGVMIGLHRDLNEDGEVFFEYLRVMQTVDGICYYATPRGYETTKYLLTQFVEEGGMTQAVFENPQHDFPRLIRYTVKADELMAQVEGIEDGQKVLKVWTWRRAEFPPNPAR
jgi:hypothetical protein